MISRVSAQYALTADLAMGLLGGKLKRMELLSARLGDVLSSLYMAAASVWRFEAEGVPSILPIARAAIRAQLAIAVRTLRELYANMPSKPLAFAAPLLLRGNGKLHDLNDRTLLAIAELLREDPSLISNLCRDVGQPKAGGLLDLMRAIELAQPIKDELPELNRVLRRTNSLEEAAANARSPAAALAYLKAADRVIQVDDFAP